MKKIILLLAALCGLFCSQSVLSVNRIYDRHSGDIIAADKDDAEFDNTNNAINTHTADTAAHGATGGVVGASKTQTLSNKTFNGDIPVWGGGDLKVYSDSGSTLKFQIDGATGDFGIPSGRKFFLDGTGLSGDTYLIETSSNIFDFFVGGTSGLRIDSANAITHPGNSFNLGVVTTNKLFLDVPLAGGAGGNDYWINSANGQNDLYSNGILTLRTASAGTILFGSNIYVPSGNHIGLDGVTNNNYFQLSTTNTISTITNGTERLNISTSANLLNGTDLNIYSDAGSTLKAKVSGTPGPIKGPPVRPGI